MTGLVAYILAKRIALGAVSGIAGITLNGNQIVFEFNDGASASMAIPLPENGKSAYEIAVDNGFIGTEQEWLNSLKQASIQELKINENNHLVCVLSDGTILDAGELPSGGDGLKQVATFNSLPNPGLINVIYITLDTGILYYWDGEYKKVDGGQGVDIGLATESDIDSLFEFPGGIEEVLDLASPEDIDSLFV